MKSVFVSSQSLQETVDYFKSFDIIDHHLFGMFLFLKSCDISETKPITKNDYIPDKKGLNQLRMLGAIFDNGETGLKHACVFPFAPLDENNNKAYFNPGTQFNGLLSRIPDLIDNSLIEHYLIRSNINEEKAYRLKPRYLNTIKELLPLGKKISIEYFSAWIYRFQEVETSDNWVNAPESFATEFTRVLIKQFKSDFRITPDEERELFQISDQLIIPSIERSTGKYLRDLMGFSNKPEVITQSSINNIPNKIIPLAKVIEMSQITGKNITEEKLLQLLDRHKQVILFGSPGTGKTWIAQSLKSKYYRTANLQFHPSTDYESFIGGVKYNPSTDKFETQKGYFLKLCEEALKNSENKYLLLIDEINRGNLTRIFGEAIVALDREYEVELLLEIQDSQAIYQRLFLKIPNNLHILGTMNSTDRSIAFVDYALRRRFTFVKFHPNYEVVRSLSDDSDMEIDVTNLFETINRKLFDTLKDEDILLGQSYFIPKWAIDGNKIKWTKETLQDTFNYSVLPILEEYTYGKQSILESIIGADLASRVLDTEMFLKAIKEQFPSIIK